LWLQTEALVEARLLHLRRHESRLIMRLLVLLLLLGLLLGHVQSLLENLHHVVTFLLFIYKLLIKNLVHVRDWVLDLREHRFEFVFEPRNNLFGHGLLELILDHLADSGVAHRAAYLDRRIRRGEQGGP